MYARWLKIIVDIERNFFKVGGKILKVFYSKNSVLFYIPIYKIYYNANKFDSFELFKKKELNEKFIKKKQENKFIFHKLLNFQQNLSSA